MRRIHYGYPYAAPVLRRDYRLLFAALVCLGAFVGIAAAFWVLNA